MVKLKKNRVDLMKAEKNALKFNAIVNFIVVLIKIIGGNILGFAALIADGFYTVSDFITDILAIIGSKVGNKRPNKRYPLGYGNFENIMQMIMGFMIFLVGIVVIVMSFNIHYQKPSLLVLIPLEKRSTAAFLLVLAKNLLLMLHHQ